MKQIGVVVQNEGLVNDSTLLTTYIFEKIFKELSFKKDMACVQNFNKFQLKTIPIVRLSRPFCTVMPYLHTRMSTH